MLLPLIHSDSLLAKKPTTRATSVGNPLRWRGEAKEAIYFFVLVVSMLALR